jgi:hypothetical protein
MGLGKVSRGSALLCAADSTLTANVHACVRVHECRLNRLASDRTWAERDEEDVYKTLWKVLNYLEVAWKALTLLNFVAFLYNGKYVDASHTQSPTVALFVSITGYTTIVLTPALCAGT